MCVVMSTHREIEATYAPDPGVDRPDLTTLSGVESLREEPSVEQRAVYFDTIDLRLLLSGVSRRRRTGGADEGWHAKVPVDGDRDEIRRPLARSSTHPPK